MGKKYEELNITDDFMFGKVMSDMGNCQATLECLLQREIGELEAVESQKQLVHTKDGKPIRMDIYTRDKASVYDAEMQNLNHQSIEQLDLPRRTRFYQSSIDMDLLEKGMDYRDLPEENVIFICTFDPFCLGYPTYTFENRCIEDLDLVLPDDTRKWYFNCACDLGKVPDNLRSFYKYMQSGEADSELTSRLAESVDKALRNDIWRSEYMKERLIFDDIRREGIAEGIAEGRAEGEAKELVNNIQRLMQNVGWSLEQACKSLGKTMKDYEHAIEIVGKH